MALWQGFANLSPEAGLPLPSGVHIFSLGSMPPIIFESRAAHAFLSGSGLTGFGHPQGLNNVLLVLRVGATHGSVEAPVLSTPGEYPTGRLEKLLGKAVLGPFRTISMPGNRN